MEKTTGVSEILSPNIASLVQGIVNRPGWKSGNALALHVSGVGQGLVIAYDLTPAKAVSLSVKFRQSKLVLHLKTKD